MGNRMNGENFLMLNTPFFKQRYSISCNFYIGCRIACQFCYYRMSQHTEPYFRHDSKLLKVGDAETLLRILNEALLVSPAPITICASSDASMIENQEELTKFLPKLNQEYKVFILHRPPWIDQEIELFKDYPHAVFSTTITPLAYEKQYNRIKDNTQIQGLHRIRKHGVPPHRISIELGPLNPENIDAGIEIAKYLYNEGIISYITIRGVSLGSYDETGELTIQQLISKNFITPEEFQVISKSYAYFNGKEEIPHEYYYVKNYLRHELEQKFYENVPRGLKVHRNTATLYRDEFGYRVSLSRNNKPRKELIQRYGATKPTQEEIQKILKLVKELTGMDGTPELTDEYLLIKNARATEDILHRVGREINYPVVFDNFSNLPTMEDLNLPAYKQILEISGIKM